MGANEFEQEETEETKPEGCGFTLGPQLSTLSFKAGTLIFANLR
jgi:hypothetical protein